MSSSSAIVSIIMPMKNASSWVKETIVSIQQQSLKEWELIIIDDCSTDNSKILVQEFIEKDERIKLFENQNSGIIPALQLGLNQARGKYMSRMDADDLMPENRLQLMVEALNSDNSRTIVTGKVTYFSKESVSDGYLKYEHWLNHRIEKQDHFDHIFRECVVASPNWMIRRDYLLKDRIFDELIYPEDYDMCFQWLKKGYKIIAIPEVTLLWREHPQRTSRNSKVYDQASFFTLKAKWFMELYPDLKSVGIVGMGQKGKLLAQLFHAKNYPFQLYDLKATKFSSPIYGKTINSSSEINDEIALIARYPENINEVQSYIEQLGYVFGKSAFWV